MTTAELVETARHEGIQETDLLSPTQQVIRAIQRARGKPACFRSDNRMGCADGECAWRRECLKLIAAWRR
jgi:hypothetical protein